MPTENPYQKPYDQTTATADNTSHTQARPTPDHPTAENPTFSTPVGYALWDIHHGKYPDRLVPHADAAYIARLKVSTFTTMRSRKTGPPYVRIFGTPYYDLADLIHWIEQKMEFSRV